MRKSKRRFLAAIRRGLRPRSKHAAIRSEVRDFIIDLLQQHALETARASNLMLADDPHAHLSEEMRQNIGYVYAWQKPGETTGVSELIARTKNVRAIAERTRFLAFGEDGEEPPQCDRCGSSAEWVRCEDCEDGYVESDEGDGIVPDIVDRICDTCEGKGGWFRCLASREWCEANPLSDTLRA